jgi:malate/lactate dehydrogenase
MEFQCLNFFQKRRWKSSCRYYGGWCNSYGSLGTSAWYAPGASVAYLVDSILNDQKKMIACSVLLKGEYEQDICIGVPCIIGKMVLKKLLRLS